MLRVAVAVVILGCAVAHADVTAPPASRDWPVACQARLERARADAAAKWPAFAAGRVEAFVDEEVVPLVHRLRFTLTVPSKKPNANPAGFWVAIEPSPPPPSAVVGWRGAGKPDRQVRFGAGQIAWVSGSMPGQDIAAMLALWKAAVDDCLDTK